MRSTTGVLGLILPLEKYLQELEVERCYIASLGAKLDCQIRF